MSIYPDIDVSPNIHRLYQHLNRGVQSMLNWRLRDLNLGRFAPQVHDLHASSSQLHPSYALSPQRHRSSVVDGITAGSSKFYSSSSSWPGSKSSSSRDHDDIYTTSGSGAGYYPSSLSAASSGSEWVSGPPPGSIVSSSGWANPRPRKFGPPPPPFKTTIYGPKLYTHPPTPIHSKHHHGPLKSFYSSSYGRPPPSKTYSSSYTPTTTSIHHDHDEWSSSGWSGSPPSSTLVLSGSSGWTDPEPSSQGWGWSPPTESPFKGSDGWGWGPKCDPDAPPFELNSLDEIPPGSTFVDGYNRTASREDLPPTLVPTLPVAFTVGVRTSLPPNYSTLFSEAYTIRINPDGTTNLEREVNHRPSEPVTGTAGGGTQSGGASRPRNQRANGNGLRMTSSVIASPYVSAPINGSVRLHSLSRTAPMV